MDHPRHTPQLPLESCCRRAWPQRHWRLWASSLSLPAFPSIEPLHWRHPDFLDLGSVLVDQCRHFLVIGNRNLVAGDTFWLQTHALERVIDLAHAVVSQLRALDKVTLVVIAALATHHHHTIPATVERVGDPDCIDRTEAAHRNGTHKSGINSTRQTRHVERRVGIVLAGQQQDARPLGKLVGHVERLDLTAHRIDRIVLKRDHAHRTSAHARSATATARFIEHREAPLILVDRTERAFHGAALALRAALKPHNRVRQVTGPRMSGPTQQRVLHRLDRLERCAGGINRGLLHVHRPPHRAGRVNAGAPRLVRETNEVRIGQTSCELRQVLALAISQIEDGDGLDFALLLFWKIDVHARIRYLTGSKHYQISADGGVFVKNQIPEVHCAARAFHTDLAHPALGEGYTLALRTAVKVLTHAG